MAGQRPEEDVRIPLVHQSWRDVTFLHWPVPPEQIRRLLPPVLEVDTFDGQAWVTLLPFRVTRFPEVRLPMFPVASGFTETNLRTYVVGPDGRDGIRFLDIEATSALMTLGARFTLGVPYNLASMEFHADGATRDYRSRGRGIRSWVHHNIHVLVGDPCPPGSSAGLPDWLTGRWRAWTLVAGQPVAVPVTHQPWPLHNAEATRIEETVLAAAGIFRPPDPPLVHYSPGVDARLGWPQPPRRR